MKSRKVIQKKRRKKITILQEANIDSDSSGADSLGKGGIKAAPWGVDGTVVLSQGGSGQSIGASGSLASSNSDTLQARSRRSNARNLCIPVT